MSTIAATPDVTWRDAVTPVSRASRRRWTACYALLLVLLAASVVDDAFAVSEGEHEQIPLIAFVGIGVIFGMLRRSTRRIAAFDHPSLDERDVAARNSAYRIAFPLLVLVIVTALVLLAIGAPDIGRRTPDGEATVVTDGWFVEPFSIAGVGLWIALWAVFLPTGVLAWREPDALEPESDVASLGESLRDALLGGALAAGIAIGVLANSNTGTLLFIAALMLLGGLGRRAAGQPMMSRQRKWRVAIGLGLLAAIFVAALVAGTAGS